MVNFFSKLKERKRLTSRVEESGSTFIVYMLLFPVMFGAFGLSTDTALAVYVKSSLQSSLDASVQSALSRATNPGVNGNTTGKPKLSSETTYNNIVSSYDKSREKLGFLKCQTSPTVADDVPGSYRLVGTPSGCNFTQYSYGFTEYNGQVSLSMGVVEKSGTAFVHMIGIKDFTYVISSDSRITFSRG